MGARSKGNPPRKRGPKPDTLALPWTVGEATLGRPSRSHRPRAAGPSHRTRRAGAADSPGPFVFPVDKWKCGAVIGHKTRPDDPLVRQVLTRDSRRGLSLELGSTLARCRPGALWLLADTAIAEERQALDEDRHRSRRHQDRSASPSTRTRRRRPPPRSPRRATTPATLDAIARLVAELESETGRTGYRRHRHPRRRLPHHRPRQERQLHLAHRPPPPGRPRSPPRPPGANRQRRQLLRPLRSHRRRRPGLRHRLRRHPRHRRRRRHRDPPADPRRPQPDRRRVGPQPAPLDDRRGARRRAPVLLRQDRLHRDLPLRPRLRARHALRPRSSRDIVRAAAAGDPHAIAALRRYEDRLARALATVINVLDPDAIVLGGGMSNLPDLAATTSALLPRYVFSDTVLTQVLPNVHGDSSGVRGAAWLWPQG